MAATRALLTRALLMVSRLPARAALQVLLSARLRPAPTPVVCGDGLLAGSEGCDDGNTEDGDGCSAFCTLEPLGVCDSDYHLELDACVSDTRACTMEPGLDEGVTAASQRWAGSSYGACNAQSCATGYSLGFVSSFPSFELRTICQPPN